MLHSILRFGLKIFFTLVITGGLWQVSFAQSDGKIFTMTANPSAGTVVLPGQPMTYNLVFTNPFTQTVEQVEISNTFPLTQLQLMAVSTPFSLLDNQLVFTLTQIPPGQVATATIEAKVWLTATTGLITQAVDAVWEGNIASAGVTHTVEAFAILSTVPAGQGGLLAHYQNLDINFNSLINRNSLGANIFVYGQQTGFHDAEITGKLDDKFITLTPKPVWQAFKPGETIMVGLQKGIQSVDGAALTSPYIWQLRAPALGGGHWVNSQKVFSVASAIAIGDLSSDQDLDIILASNDANQANSLWLRANAGNEIYNKKSLGFGPTNDVVMADLNYDSYLDVVFTHPTGDEIWLVDSKATTLTFVLKQTLQNKDSYQIVTGDVNGDGYLDLVITKVGANAQNELWLNNRRGAFVLAPQSLGGGDRTPLALGDVDNDGDLDVWVGVDGKLQFYINDGTGKFTLRNAELISLEAMAVGDLDDDGDLDVFIVRAGTYQAVWLNDGQGNFEKGFDAFLGVNEAHRVTLGDFDGDNDLDALVSGGPNGNKLWLNDGQGNFTWARQRLPQSSFNLADIALGDMDADGTLDVVAVPMNNKAELWYNRTKATGVFISREARLGNENTTATDLRDLDGDGDLDVFVANRGRQTGRQTSASNEVWLNDGTGQFTNTQQSLGQTQSTAIDLGDIDGDGDDDAVVGDDDNQGNQVWLNDGTGIFTNTGQSLGQGDTQAIDLGDIDHDGDLDVLVGNGNNQGNQVWLNDGTGIFTDTGQTLGQSNTQAISLADIDNDGDLDTLIGNSNQGNQVWLNDGTGIFTNTGQSLGQGDTQAISLGDIDNDGDTDMMVGQGSQEGNQVWLNDGTGIFTDTAQSLGQSNTQAISLGDMDQDGDLDAAIGNNEDSQVWLNDGTGIFTDTGQILSNGDSQAISLGDLDQDGDIDIFLGHDGPNDVLLNGDTYIQTYLPLIKKP